MCPIKASVSGHWNRSEFVRCGTHGADIIVVGKPDGNQISQHHQVDQPHLIGQFHACVWPDCYF
ncbi:uncharacterized protein LOC119770437 isoform X4 [Culex quinquefasciatus]|uniref:uncharacterized protein LOC119770437 isoform X4 n=1 Tax=Culex quinquefasciatus TaxID=7176 RepID=UPI0018E3EC9A|nr:uncharacterized protein LOC119770437 isoform X4 [Culex quinquefasciatus]